MVALCRQYAGAAQALITDERLLYDRMGQETHSLWDVLDEAVSPGNGPAIGSDFFGVTRSDRGDGLELLAGPVPLALFVLELRYWGQRRYISGNEMQQRIDTISGYAREAYSRAPYLMTLAGAAEGQQVYRSVRTAATTQPGTPQRMAAVIDIQNAIHRYLHRFADERANLEAALAHANRVFGVQVPHLLPAGAEQLQRPWWLAGLHPPTSRGPQSTAGSGGPPVAGRWVGGVPSPRVRAAVERIVAEAGVVDCVTGVGRVLAALGPSATWSDDSVVPFQAQTVAQWLGGLGGHFEDGSLDGLLELRPGHVTAVWLQPPAAEAHLVLVERPAGDRFVVVDVTVTGEGRYLAFDPAAKGYELPPVLVAPVRLVRTPNRGLAQLPAAADTAATDTAATDPAALTSVETGPEPVDGPSDSLLAATTVSFDGGPPPVAESAVAAQEPGESPAGAPLPVVRAAADVQQFRIPAPAGTWYEGPVLVVDSGNAGRGNGIVALVVDAARSARRPVIVINVRGGLAAESPELTALRTALHRYQRFGVSPVVVATSDTQAIAALREQYGPATIQPASAGLDHVWTLRGPDGAGVSTSTSLSQELFAAADAMPVQPDGSGLPPALAGLLAQNTWADGEQYLRDHVADLLRPDVEEAMRDLRRREPDDRTVGAYDVILRLVRAAGGVAHESQQRFAPVGGVDMFVPAVGWDSPLPEPLRETFAFDYLRPFASVGVYDDPLEKRKLRKPWDDRLLWLMYEGGKSRDPETGKAWRADMAALASGLRETSERRTAAGGGDSTQASTGFDRGKANATVFAAISTVLGIDAAMLRQLDKAPAEPRNLGRVHPPFGEAVRQIASCQLDPADRLAWLTRMNALEKKIAADGKPELARLLTLLTETLASC
jgi:hypothetical protein